MERFRHNLNPRHNFINLQIWIPLASTAGDFQNEDQIAVPHYQGHVECRHFGLEAKNTETIYFVMQLFSA